MHHLSSKKNEETSTTLRSFERNHHQKRPQILKSWWRTFSDFKRVRFMIGNFSQTHGPLPVAFFSPWKLEGRQRFWLNTFFLCVFFEGSRIFCGPQKSWFPWVPTHPKVPANWWLEDDPFLLGLGKKFVLGTVDSSVEGCKHELHSRHLCKQSIFA